MSKHVVITDENDPRLGRVSDAGNKRPRQKIDGTRAQRRLPKLQLGDGYYVSLPVGIASLDWEVELKLSKARPAPKKDGDNG